MTTVFWTPQARDDLAAIHEFIARESPHYADLVVRELIGQAERAGEVHVLTVFRAERLLPALRQEPI